jgi:hypothetical protein
LLKPVVVGGPANSAALRQAVPAHAEIVRDFLKANGMATAESSSDAKTSVMRLICVRK